jgi:hypothetical protein
MLPEEDQHDVRATTAQGSGEDTNEQMPGLVTGDVHERPQEAERTAAHRRRQLCHGGRSSEAHGWVADDPPPGWAISTSSQGNLRG